MDAALETLQQSVVTPDATVAASDGIALAAADQIASLHLRIMELHIWKPQKV